VSFIQVSERGIKIVQRDLKRMQEKFKKAIRKAAYTAARDGIPVIKREVQKELAIKKGGLSGIRHKKSGPLGREIYTPSRGALLTKYQYGAPKGELIGGRRAGHRRRRESLGVIVQVKKSGWYRHLPKAFITNIQAGEKRIKVIAMRYPNDSRRFRVLYGPSLSQAMETLRPKIEPKIADKFERELTRQIKLITKG